MMINYSGIIVIEWYEDNECKNEKIVIFSKVYSFSRLFCPLFRRFVCLGSKSSVNSCSLYFAQI
jgi:hypothetical protein